MTRCQCGCGPCQALYVYALRRGKGAPTSEAATTATARRVIGELYEFQGAKMEGLSPKNWASAVQTVVEIVPPRTAKRKATWATVPVSPARSLMGWHRRATRLALPRRSLMHWRRWARTLPSDGPLDPSFGGADSSQGSSADPPTSAAGGDALTNLIHLPGLALSKSERSQLSSARV